MGAKNKNTQESAEHFYKRHNVDPREKSPIGYEFPLERTEEKETVNVRLSNSTTPMPYID